METSSVNLEDLRPRNVVRVLEHMIGGQNCPPRLQVLPEIRVIQPDSAPAVLYITFATQGLDGAGNSPGRRGSAFDEIKTALKPYTDSHEIWDLQFAVPYRAEMTLRKEAYMRILEEVGREETDGESLPPETEATPTAVDETRGAAAVWFHRMTEAEGSVPPGHEDCGVDCDACCAGDEFSPNLPNESDCDPEFDGEGCLADGTPTDPKARLELFFLAVDNMRKEKLDLSKPAAATAVRNMLAQAASIYTGGANNATLDAVKGTVVEEELTLARHDAGAMVVSLTFGLKKAAAPQAEPFAMSFMNGEGQAVYEALATLGYGPKILENEAMLYITMYEDLYRQLSK